MAKKSGIYKHGGRSFRYNYDTATVEYVQKATQEDHKDNEKWLAKFGEPLWKIDDKGYIIIDEIGLMRENWKNKEARDEYLDEYIFQIDEMVASEMAYL